MNHKLVTEQQQLDGNRRRAAHDPALNVSAPLNSALLSSAPHVSAPPRDRDQAYRRLTAQ